MIGDQSARYRGRYPRFGQIAMLCEGDCAGFEVDLLEKWLSDSGVFADVWPCGTKGAIFGVCDAIGRSVPIVVVEDRDYRSFGQAEKDCEAKAKDRTKRSIRMQAWTSWQRNEIENYLIEPQVCVPVLADAFHQESTVIARILDKLIPSLAVDQASQAAIARFFDRFPDRAKFIPGLPRRTARPQWDKDKNSIIVPSLSVVETELRNVIGEKSTSFRNAAANVSADDPLKEFRVCYEQWRTITIDSLAWRVDWAGKEVLSCLVRWLAGEFGWPINGTNERTRIDWAIMKREDGDALERHIMAVLQPRFVETILNLLKSALLPQVNEEWNSLRKLILNSGTNG